MKPPFFLRLTTAAVATALLGGCGQASDAGTPTAPLEVDDTSVPVIPVVEPSCIADYRVYDDVAELLFEADAVVRVTATGPSRDYEVFPDPPSDDPDPAVNPQYGVPQEEIDQIPGIPETAITMRVTQSLKGELAVGDVIEVAQGTCTDRPLPTGPDTDYALALNGSATSEPWYQLNEAQAGWQVDAIGGLHPVDPNNDLQVETLDDLASVAEGQPYRACTLIGNAEGVSVDLSDVLDPEGGDYYAEVRVDSAGASETRGFAGNDGYGRGGSVQVDLTSDPVRVDVIVRSTHGPDGDPATATEVYRASGEVTPELFQPNGPECDGENYHAVIKATASGDLVAVS